jgi:hypothetical protein
MDCGSLSKGLWRAAWAVWFAVAGNGCDDSGATSVSSPQACHYELYLEGIEAAACSGQFSNVELMHATAVDSIKVATLRRGGKFALSVVRNDGQPLNGKLADVVLTGNAGDELRPFKGQCVGISGKTIPEASLILQRVDDDE